MELFKNWTNFCIENLYPLLVCFVMFILGLNLFKEIKEDIENRKLEKEWKAEHENFIRGTKNEDN